jgi:hypothetical protein
VSTFLVNIRPEFKPQFEKKWEWGVGEKYITGKCNIYNKKFTGGA